MSDKLYLRLSVKHTMSAPSIQATPPRISLVATAGVWQAYQQTTNQKNNTSNLETSS